MSTEPTKTLDDNVVERLHGESQAGEKSFPSGPLKIKPSPMGYDAGLNYDDVESLLEISEGPQHR